MDGVNAGNTVEAVNVPEITGKKRGLSGSTLKLIAVLAMLTDHFAAVVQGRYLMNSGYMELALAGDINGLMLWLQENAGLYWSNMIMRLIGRIAFPIFVFLLIEGFQRTHSKWKYAARLGLFALISEIPFDLALSGKALEFSYQNVYFTLFLGLLVLIAFDGIGKKKWFEKKAVNATVKALASIAVLAAFCVIAQFLRTDYAAIGVFCIAVLYLLRKSKPWQIAVGCILFLWEITAPLAFLPIGFYNGERGLKLKYLFYAFYPLHLLALYLICVFLGIAGYSAV